MKDWGLLPKGHVLDDKILLGIIDKDRDNVFSYDDFVNNLPSFDSENVARFALE